MLCWGAAYVPSGWLVETWSPLSAAAVRLTLGGAVILGTLATWRRPVRPRVEIATVAWLALTQTVLFYGATYWGIAHAGAGLAALLANTDPLFVAILAAALLGERLAGAQWLGLWIGLAGAGIVVWEGVLWPPGLSVDALVVVGGAVAWSLGTVAAARSVRGDAEPLALAGWQMVVGGVVLGIVGLVAGEADHAAGVREAILILWLGLVGSAAPLALFYLALVRSPASEVSAWFFLIPVIGVLSAWPLLDETPGPRVVLGLAGIAVGLWLVLARQDSDRGRLVDSALPP